MPDRREEVPDDVFNPFKSPSRLMAAMAQVAMPVLLDRLGGSATWTDDEWQALAERHGGKVGIEMSRHSSGRWKAKIISERKLRLVPELDD